MINHMICGGWDCGRIFKITEKVNDRYCSLACYEDYELRKKNSNWSLNKEKCICGNSPYKHRIIPKECRFVKYCE